MPRAQGVRGWMDSPHFAAMGLAWISLVGIAAGEAQVADSTQKLTSPKRLLSREEGRAIVTDASEQSTATPETRDCSHLVHQIYLNAGFDYPYVSSTEMYRGNKSFARVKFPRAGDLIVWPGHMGIVVDPLRHSFYSLVSTGLEEQDYESPYWRSRGRPHFFRYRVENSVVLTATRTSRSSQISANNVQNAVTRQVEERSSGEASDASRPPQAAPDQTALLYGPPVPPELAKAAPAFETPSSIGIVSGSRPPTREDVAKGISALNAMSGKVLQSDDLFSRPMPVVIVDQFSVERVEIKREHGWAQLRIDSKVCVGCGLNQPKGAREKVRWELRRTESGWEVVPPADRTYVSHDEAVRNLAGQLALLAESDGAAAHQETVLRQESQLANLLSALLGRN